jgi:ribosomal-protein-alanine N-acetyltransferase
MGEGFRIRLLRPEDRPTLAEIESEVFSDPWPGAAFDALLGPYAIAAERDGRVVGFVLGRAVADEGEVLNLAVVPDQRRRGVARALLDELLKYLTDDGVRLVFLEVRESNEGALAFYEKAGFERVGRRPGYYRLPREDALVMRRCIGADPGAQKNDAKGRIFG